MKLSCLIVDDEPVARKGLEEYVRETDFLELKGQCENALKAASLIHDQPVDLIYLDIQMPRISGIEFLKGLRHPPLVILTTAFSDYAVEGYALDIVDYLMKPITFGRFLKATQKALDIFQMKRLADERREFSGDYFFIKCDSKYEKVNFIDVRYIEALQNYVVIHTRDKKLITYITMTGLEAQLPKDQFMRVHKSYIVSVASIRSVDGNEILIDNATIPISRSLKDAVISRILGNNLYKR